MTPEEVSKHVLEHHKRISRLMEFKPEGASNAEWVAAIEATMHFSTNRILLSELAVTRQMLQQLIAALTSPAPPITMPNKEN